MDASDDQSDGESKFDDSDDNFRYCKRETKVLLKKEPGTWIDRNPGRLLEVINLKLELPDHVYSISDSIGDLLNLQHVMIDRGINLNSLPYTLPTLLNLERLQLENCPNLSQLPSNFGNLAALRFLTIRNCGIKYLPHCLSLLKLWELELNNCVFIQELPPCLDVHTLRLVGSHVKNFSAVPRHLLSLEFTDCLYVPDILTSLNHFHSLLSLQIKGCDMESLPNSITGIQNLGDLEIKDCMKLKRLPQNLIQLADLYGLTLVNCGLESIPSGLVRLERLSIENCPMEFHVIKEFVSLSYVTIKSCNIKSLDGCITGLTKLKRLSIQDCVALEDLPSDINTLVSLETLCIEGCTSIKFLPNIAALQNLYYLSLKGCSRLDVLPADFDELTNLESLYLTDTNVHSLPSTISKLPDLKYVHLPWCFRLETLPNDFDLKGIQIFLPLSFRLDTLPDKFLVTTIYFSYQLHLKDQKESSLELIHDKECDVDVADKSDEYWQTMVNTPPNLTHLPQPRPGKDKHIMNYSRVMSQRESRDSESIESESRDSNSHTVKSKALSKEAISPLRTEKRKMVGAIDGDQGMKQRKSQICTRDGRCESRLSSTQDKMYTVWAKYEENEINFKFKAESSFAELKQELAERFPLEGGKLKIKYLDAPENLGRGDPNAFIVRDWVLMTCDADLRHSERYSLGMKILLIVQEYQDGRS